MPDGPVRWQLPREAGWLIAAVAAVVPAWGLRGAPGPLYEEGFTVLHAQLVQAGQTPGVDFHALYGPLGPWFMSGWFRVFGASIGAQRVVGALLLVAIVLGVRQLLRPWGRNTATVAAVVTSVVVYSAGTLVAVAWWFAFAAVLWAMVLLRIEGPQRPAAWAGAGILSGLAIGFRPDVALAVALAGGAAWWVGRNADERCRLVRPVLGGLAAGLMPLAIYTLVLGPARAWRVLVVGPVFTLRPYRSLPPPPFGELQGLSRSLRLAPDWPLPAPPLAAQVALWFWVSVAATLMLVLAAVRARRTTPALVPVAALALALLPQLVQRPDLGHLALTTAVPLAALPVTIATLLSHNERTRVSVGTQGDQLRPELGVLALLPVVVVLVLFPAPTLGPWTRALTGQSTRDASQVTVGDRSLPVARSLAPPVQRVVNDLAGRAQPGDRLIVAPSDLTRAYDNPVALYTLFPDLTVGTYHSEMDPGFTNVPGSSLPDELTQADWVLVSPPRPQLAEPNRSADAGDPAAQRAFDARFCPVVETQVLSLWGVCPTAG
ncbi:MAG: glycosyltransferase family 39 protein [Microthrixaceae bacterium]